MKAQSCHNEAAENDLVSVGRYRHTDRQVKLHSSAAKAWQDMAAQARAEGVFLVPISGFRTQAYQESLFARAIVRHGSEEAAARWVARPGHSEHQTGMAIDVGDEHNPGCDVESDFEKTAAFAWLQGHARIFGFEMSYPRNNHHGVDYEPWHWRFVGTAKITQLFHP